ncbi:MAG: hypothetical protein KBA51_00770 [Kiritimatiellae bacterium]|nr:hypothetical protein [Kiritimatiellia bacterium]
MSADAFDAVPPPVPGRSSRVPRTKKMPVVPAWGVLPVLVLLVLLIGPLFVWFFCRIEPEKDRIAIFYRKTGKTLPSGQIIALEEGQKGIQLEVKPTGRYFRNPYTWGWMYHNVVDVPAGKMGVQTRLYGDPLPADRIIAEDGMKGLVADVLSPGKYFINPYAYSVQMLDAVTIRPGHIGVVTSLTGADPITSTQVDENPNEFMVRDGFKGVIERRLDPGTHYINPYLFKVNEVSLQSQRFEMSGEDAITFLTLDGFTVTVEGTLEFAVMREKAAELTHRVGDLDDVVKKVILPRARGFSRIEGSKNKATNYIVGESRQQFQNVLESHLRERCAQWGVDIKSVLIRNIRPPDDIARVIREREVTVQEARKFDQQIEQAKSKAELTKQEMLAVQNKAKVDAETVKIRALIQAQQEQEVRMQAAQREMDVARLENEAATFQALATVRRAEAEGQVIQFDNTAQAEVIRNQTAAFGTGMNFARFVFYRELGPRLESVMTTDGPDALGGLFRAYLPQEVK